MIIQDRETIEKIAIEEYGAFKINDDSFGWNVDEKRFGRINDTKLSQDFLDDFKTLLSSLSVEQIEE